MSGACIFTLYSKVFAGMGRYGPGWAGLKKGSGGAQAVTGPGSEVPTTTLNLTHSGTGPAQEVLRSGQVGPGVARRGPGTPPDPRDPRDPSRYGIYPLGADPLAGLRQEVYMYMRIMPFGIRFQGKLTDLVVILNESVSKTRYARARAE